MDSSSASSCQSQLDFLAKRVKELEREKRLLLSWMLECSCCSSKISLGAAAHENSLQTFNSRELANKTEKPSGASSSQVNSIEQEDAERANNMNCKPVRSLESGQKEKLSEIEIENSLDNESIVVPVVGMIFSSEDEVRNYYRDYAYKVGFGVTKRSARKQNGLRYFTLACSRYGTYESSSSNPRPTTASNCQARINVKVSREGQHEISKVVLDHSHTVSPGKSRRFRCIKKMDMHARLCKSMTQSE